MRISDWSSDVCSSDLDDNPIEGKMPASPCAGLVISMSRIVGRSRSTARRRPSETRLPTAMADASKLQETPMIAGCMRSEEHTSELQSLMRNSYGVFCLKKKKKKDRNTLAETLTKN